MSFEGPISKGFLKTKWFDVLTTSIVFMSVFITMSTKCYLGSVFQLSSSVLTTAWDLVIDFGLVMTLTQLVLQISKRRELKKLLQMLHNFDRDIQRLDLKVDYKGHKAVSRIATFLFFTLTIFSYVIMPGLYFITEAVTIIVVTVFVSNMLIGLFTLFYAIQFNLACFAVQCRFKLLNQTLRLAILPRNHKTIYLFGISQILFGFRSCKSV